MEIELKKYSNASNARRAATAAGLDGSRVYKVSDGCFKIRVAAESPTAAPMCALTGVDERKAPKAKVVRKAKPAKVSIARAKAPKKATARIDRTPSEKPGTKGAQLIEMVSRGATISELMKTLGWLPHTTRGALSRLSTAGYNIQRTKVGAESHYKIAS